MREMERKQLIHLIKKNFLFYFFSHFVQLFLQCLCFYSIGVFEIYASGNTEKEIIFVRRDKDEWETHLVPMPLADFDFVVRQIVDIQIMTNQLFHS
jgi:hypothetical protein